MQLFYNLLIKYSEYLANAYQVKKMIEVRNDY